jgi:hypothetical protein
MYEGDSFYTLSGAGQVGLLILTLTLSVGILALGFILMRRRRFIICLCIAAVLFFAFVWLSPQIYYAYYQVLFDGLPWQIVVKSPPGPATLWQLLSFSGDSTLSAHGQGLLGWLLIVMAHIRPKAVSASPPDDRV